MNFAGQREGKIDRAALLLGVLALAVYIPGAWWGLPQATSPDTIIGWNVGGLSATQPLAEIENIRNPKPDWHLWYPPFHHFVLVACFAPYIVYLLLTGGMVNPVGVYPFGLTDPVAALYTLAAIGRAVTVLMAAGTVAAAYLTGKTVWNARTGILAALIVLLLNPMFYFARTGNLDGPVLFWMALGLLAVARILKHGFTVRRAIWLGTLIALATATKDQCAAAWVPVMIVLVVWHRRGRLDPQGTAGQHGWKPPLAMVASGAAVYSVAGALVISPHRFVRHMRTIGNFGTDAQNIHDLGLAHSRTLAGYAALAQETGRMFQEALSPLILIVALLGVVLLWRKTPFARILLVASLGHLLLFIAPIAHMQYRYTLPVVYALAFFAARVLTIQLDSGSMRKASAVAVLIAGLGWMTFRGVDLSYQMIFDARYEASRWIEGQFQPGDRGVYFGDASQLPLLPYGLTPRHAPEDGDLEFIEQERARFAFVIQDWSTKEGSDHSRYLSPETYERLKDGSLGYRLAARFETRALWRRFFAGHHRYVVNPAVRIFEAE